jgi:hypothetical protein
MSGSSRGLDPPPRQIRGAGSAPDTTRNRRRRAPGAGWPGLGSGATIAIAVTALDNLWFAAVVAVLAASVLYGVVMPAIWSRCPARQRAARAVIRDLLCWTQRRL